MNKVREEELNQLYREYKEHLGKRVAYNRQSSEHFQNERSNSELMQHTYQSQNDLDYHGEEPS